MSRLGDNAHARSSTGGRRSFAAARLSSAAKRPRARADCRGVTLLELLAVVAVIGILSLIALPSYRAHTMRAHRVDAKAALLKLAANQERFYVQHRRYGGAADFAALGFASPMTSELGAYAITIASDDATIGYTATATVAAGGRVDQRQDRECQSFTIDERGARRAWPDPDQRCW